MTTTPPEAPSGAQGSHDRGPHDQGPRVTRDEVRDLGRLRRSVTDRKVAGVAGGLARHLDVDPVILRVAFVVLVFFGGAGLIVYGACWLLVPEEGSGSAPLHLDDRSRAIALLIAGVVAAAALVGDSWGGASWFPWPLAVVALVALVVLTRRDGSRVPPAPPAGPEPSAGQPGAPGQATTGPTAPPYAAPQPDPSPYDPAATYAPPSAPAGPPAYPPTTWSPTPPRPRSPRRRGPILFWFTLALIVLAEGVLGIVDLAGASVAGSAYPALAVGVTGLMLLVGAFWGRAGGLILLGLVSTAALAGATATDQWDGTTLHETPASATAVTDGYDIHTGELVLDLTDVRDLGALDGRTIHVDGDVGRLEVILPAGLDATAHADVNGPGSISLFGDQTGGIDIGMSRTHDAGTDVPEITIDAQLSVGRIEVHQ